MSSYLLTITFLTLMGFLTTSEIHRFTQSYVEQKCYLSTCSTRLVTEQIKEQGHLEKLRGEENPEPLTPTPRIQTSNPKQMSSRMPPLRIHPNRPPDNSRLNLYRILQEESARQNGFSFYEVLARLIRDLYQKEPFFYQGFEHEILAQFVKHKIEILQFTGTEALASLAFDNAHLQNAFFHMLQGTKSSPSLLNYLTLNPIDSPKSQSRKINLLFADPAILHAIFPDCQIAEQLIAERQNVWLEILNQEATRLKKERKDLKGRLEFKEALKKVLQKVLDREGYSFKNYKTHVFDCGLSEPGTLIFITDPHTGHQHRETYLPHPSK